MTQAFGEALDADQSNSSERVLRPMDIDEQELIPDYAALPQAGNLEGFRAMTGRPLKAEAASGKGGPPSAKSASMVPVEALGPLVAQMMQPWMEQMMNDWSRWSCLGFKGRSSLEGYSGEKVN